MLALIGRVREGPITLVLSRRNASNTDCQCKGALDRGLVGEGLLTLVVMGRVGERRALLRWWSLGRIILYKSLKRLLEPVVTYCIRESKTVHCLRNPKQLLEEP